MCVGGRNCGRWRGQGAAAEPPGKVSRKAEAVGGSPVGSEGVEAGRAAGRVGAAGGGAAPACGPRGAPGGQPGMQAGLGA